MCIYAYAQKERQRNKERESAGKTNRKKLWFDFHNKKNLKHLYYEFLNFTFNAKEK